MSEVNNEKVKKLIRNEKLSTQASNIVYFFEDIFTQRIKGLRPEEYGKVFDKALESANYEFKRRYPDVVVYDARYSPELGVACLAVHDPQTNEVIVAFAGTNIKADGLKDVASDVAIGMYDEQQLKELADFAIGFTRDQEKLGYDVTVATGHSYGDFIASRVAAELGLPYKKGYQGAPLSVPSLTKMERNHPNLDLLKVSKLAEFTQLKMDIQKLRGAPKSQIWLQSFYDKTYSNYLVTQTAYLERQRLTNLYKDYKGDAVNYATNQDFLTKLLHRPSSLEVEFPYSLDLKILGNSFRLDRDAILGLSRYLPRYMIDTKYLGRVEHVNLFIPHDMQKVLNNPEMMNYIKNRAAKGIMAIDFGHDGQVDYTLSAKDIAPVPLYRLEWGTQHLEKDQLNAAGYIEGEIIIDVSGMNLLITQLKNRHQSSIELVEALKFAQQQNDQVMNSLANRRDQLKELVIDFFERSKIIRSIELVDQLFHDLEELIPAFATMKNNLLNYFENTYNDVVAAYVGNSGGDIYTSPWKKETAQAHIENVVVLLHRLQLNSETVIFSNLLFEEGEFSLGARTTIGKLGERTIQSFEPILEKSTTGTGLRQMYQDGIPEAIKEILNVVHQNMVVISDNIRYIIEVSTSIRTLMMDKDYKLANHIAVFTLPPNEPPVISVSADYETYLKETTIFDDYQVIVAFDRQVDERSVEIADGINKSIVNYLSKASDLIAETGENLRLVKDAFADIESDCNKEIIAMATHNYYQVPSIHSSHLGMGADLVYARSMIPVYEGFVSRLFSMHLDASYTINDAIAAVGGIERVLRDGMEDAFYGAIELDQIVNAQRATGRVLDALCKDFGEFYSLLKLQNKGAAVKALAKKIEGLLVIMEHTRNLINDSFGD